MIPDRWLALVLLGATAACGGASTPSSGGDEQDAKTTKYPAGIHPKEASELKTLVTAATSKRWSCSFDATSLGGKPVHGEKLAYTLTESAADIGGAEHDPKRDYFIAFATTDPIANPDDATKPIDGSETILVGFFSSVTPTLTVAAGVYTYEFHGALTDHLEVSATNVVFRKLGAAGTAILTIACAAA